MPKRGLAYLECFLSKFISLNAVSTWLVDLQFWYLRVKLYLWKSTVQLKSRKRNSWGSIRVSHGKAQPDCGDKEEVKLKILIDPALASFRYWLQNRDSSLERTSFGKEIGFKILISEMTLQVEVFTTKCR